MSLRLLLVPFAAFVVLAQTETSPEETAKKLTTAHDVWGPRASSPNSSLTFVEESRQGADFRYGLRATGIPPGSIFNLVAWPVTQREPAEVLQGVTFDAQGIAVCAGRPGTCGDPANPNDPIHIPFRPVPGEPIRLAIVSSDGSIKAFAKITPLPLQGDDKACHVNATLLMPGAVLIFVEGTGFPSNSELTMSTDSEGEKHDLKGKVDTQGRFTLGLLPYKQGLSRGTVKIVLKGIACAPSVSVPWGKPE